MFPSFSHFFPFLRPGRLEHCVADVLRLQGISEGGAGWLSAGDALEKVGDLVDETVFVTDLQTGNPPFVHIRMVAVGDVDGAPAADAAFIAVLKELESVEIVEVPENRGLL